jgi:hypothetical protein
VAFQIMSIYTSKSEEIRNFRICVLNSLV